MHDIVTVLGLLAVVSALVPLANRLGVPYPILLVIAGLILGFVPNKVLPDVALAPDLVFLLFLPPLLYWDAVTTRWRDFRANLRPIGSLAIGLVVVTTCGVAAIAHVVLGLPWAVAFVLGAVVSSTDAVATSSIASRLGVRPRIITVLSGECLVNDGTALVVYSAAVAAVVQGAFSLPQAALRFVVASAGGRGHGTRHHETRSTRTGSGAGAPGWGLTVDAGLGRRARGTVDYGTMEWRGWRRRRAAGEDVR